MFRRTISIGVLVAALAGATPVAASSHVILQKTSAKRALGYLTVTAGLRPGHRYRLEVASIGHSDFQGYGFEELTYIYKKNASRLNQSLKLKGSTPKSFTLVAPNRGRLTSWLLGLSVQTKNHRRLTVRVVDLGR